MEAGRRHDDAFLPPNRQCSFGSGALCPAGSPCVGESRMTTCGSPASAPANVSSLMLRGGRVMITALPSSEKAVCKGIGVFAAFLCSYRGVRPTWRDIPEP